MGGFMGSLPLFLPSEFRDDEFIVNAAGNAYKVSTLQNLYQY
jgi:hypothetical protein